MAKPVPNSLPSPAVATTRVDESAPAATKDWTGATPKIDLLFDSGAFSAWKLGKPINLDTYCDYLLANRAWMGAYVALDVINPESPEAAAKASFDNYMHMRKRGLDPIPVFHVKEDISWLYRMIDASATYIGLSASSLVSRNHVNDWYAHCWDRLTDSSGRPLIKAHAFGEGREEAMAAFPWYSCDSTSWIYAAQRTGLIPLGNGKSVSHRNDHLNDKAKQDIDALLPPDREAFLVFLDRHGISERAFDQRGYEAKVVRTYLTLQFYLDQEKRVNARCPILHNKNMFLADYNSSAIDRAALDLPEIKYYSVLGGNPDAWSCLAYSQSNRGLVSYFYAAAPNSGYDFKVNRSLIDYVYGASSICAITDPMARSWAVLKEYVNV